MQDARYLRAQAALCLEIANELSDLKAAEKLRADATDYQRRAVELELKQDTPPPPPPKEAAN
jgi:hypothetical protein